jgi:hypothetical protein
LPSWPWRRRNPAASNFAEISLRASIGPNRLNEIDFRQISRGGPQIAGGIA